jgi:hypothetical protein
MLMARLCLGVNFTYDQRNGRHHRTPPDSKRDVLDVHVYNIMAINSADIVSYTAFSAGVVRLFNGNQLEERYMFGSSKIR